MNTAQVMDMVNLLDDQVDDIEEALAPLLKSSLQDIAAKLPVVDKARLYVLTAYAIDSLLFSYLRLNGVNAREHPVMHELERVKQYVKKINEAQAAATEVKREVTLNKAVVARFVKHDLAGNDQWDREHAAEKVREKAAAHTKFEELSRKIEKRKAENPTEEEEEEGGEEECVEKQGSDCESDEESLEDKYKDEEILDITDTEEDLERKAKNEEQVNRIIDAFKNYGVAITHPGGKRKLIEDTLELMEESENRRKIGRKAAKKELLETKAAENASKSHNGEEVPKPRKKRHHRKAAKYM